MDAVERRAKRRRRRRKGRRERERGGPALCSSCALPCAPCTVLLVRPAPCSSCAPPCAPLAPCTVLLVRPAPCSSCALQRSLRGRACARRRAAAGGGRAHVSGTGGHCARTPRVRVSRRVPRRGGAADGRGCGRALVGRRCLVPGERLWPLLPLSSCSWPRARTLNAASQRRVRRHRCSASPRPS